MNGSRVKSGLGIAAIALAVAALPAPAEPVRMHGVTLDETHRVIIEEGFSRCKVGYVARSRVRGARIDPNLEGPDPNARKTPVRFLVEVRVEILKASGPNYLQNPGEFYRITFETLDMYPAFGRRIEVDADNARDAVIAEFMRLGSLNYGIDKKVLFAAGPLVLEIFKEAERLPAEIFESVMQSRSARYRITPGTRQRRSIPAPQTFAPDLRIARPELGATARQRNLAALPDNAASPFQLALPTPERIEEAGELQMRIQQKHYVDYFSTTERRFMKPPFEELQGEQ